MKSTAPYINHGLPQVQWIEITPKLATEWLDHWNTGNRRKRDKHIDALVRDLQNDRYLVTGDPIRFDTDGRLIDGQHRLSAIAKSGVSAWALVITELDPQVQIVIDANAKRSARDALFFEGVEGNRNIIGGMINIAMLRERGGLSNSMSSSGGASFTNSEIIAWIEDNPDALDAADLASRTYKAIGCYPSILAYAILVLSRIDRDGAFEYVNSMAEMRTDGVGDPRLALINALKRPESKNRHTANATQLFFIFRAWNAWRDGHQLNRMSATTRSGAITIPQPI